MLDDLSELRRKSQKCRLRPMRRVRQKTGTSCGVACVAMLAHVSFKDAFEVGLQLWGQDYWNETHRTDSAELREMLAALGWRLGRMVKCRTWRKVPPGALVAVQRKLPKNEWHWVVSHADVEGVFFFDPRLSVKANRRRDFAKAPPSWYHRVSTL